jgi:RHS repeat-associated protein
MNFRQGANVIASFDYDSDGRRTRMTTASGTIRFHYDGTSTRVLYETDGDGNLIALYVYGANGQLLAMVRDGQTYYYHYNGHGDVIALTDVGGNVVKTYEYDAFGNHIGTTGNVNNPYRYAGYRGDEETGLYYLNARYYMPSVGRFITRDAFHGFEEDPHSLNWYNYAHSNPVMFVDPSGYVIVNVIGAVVGAGLGALFGVLVANHYRLTGWKRTATIAGFAAGMAVIGWFAAPFLTSLANLVLIKAGLTKATRMDLQFFTAKKEILNKLLISQTNIA